MDTKNIFDNFLEGTIYGEKQVEESGIHLTVQAVYALAGRGQTDFGGGEHRPCKAAEISSVKRDPEDDYGWWELGAGHYRVSFNESLISGGGVFLLLPNDRIIACGCVLAPVIATSGKIATVLSVHQKGVGIKENARIAILRRLGD